jgi:serine/threonine protein phosphatase PrpC
LVDRSFTSPEKRQSEDRTLIEHRRNGTALIAIADGMGGHRNAARGAELVCETLRAAFREAGEARLKVLEGFERANEQLIALDAGVTVVAAILDFPSLWLLHCGDSQAVIFDSQGVLKLRTIAHGPVGYAVEAGFLTEKAGFSHRDRHYVTNFLGAPHPHISVSQRIILAPTDTLILASDGLFDNLTMQAIAREVAEPDVNALADALTNKARARMQSTVGKPDDFSLAIFRGQESNLAIA